MDLIISILVTAFLLTAMVVHIKHGELFRPMVGTLLFRKPKIALNVDTQLLFKIGNHGNHVLSFADLNHSHERLVRFIRNCSWFKKTDMDRLKKHYVLMWNAIYRHEQQKAARQEKERQRERAARQKKKPAQNPKLAEWRCILGIDAHCRDPKVIKANYRKLVSKEHPDKGGSGKRMPEFNRAIEEARSELGFV